MNKENLDDLSPENLTSVAISLSKTVNTRYYSLAKVLHRIKETQAYKYIDNEVYAIGNAGWQRFCEDKLEISYRTAQYWVNMYEYFESMNLTLDELQQISWSKAKELVNVTDNREELLRLIEYARHNGIESLKSLVSKVKSEKLDITEPLNTYETIKFRLPAYQANEVTKAIELAKDVFSIENDNEAFAAVALDWLQNFDTQKERD